MAFGSTLVCSAAETTSVVSLTPQGDSPSWSGLNAGARDDRKVREQHCTMTDNSGSELRRLPTRSSRRAHHVEDDVDHQLRVGLLDRVARVHHILLGERTEH